MRPVIALEINEVPWRLIDRYANVDAFPNIRRFFEQSHQYTSVTEDTGELSPWVTWPTMHRGMNNEAHGVRNLGQDPETFRGTPVWEEFRRKGITIGVCGPMQSWPPIQPGKGGFFVPDTFAHDATCSPKYLEPLQSLNLSQVRKNPRVLTSSVPSLKEISQLFSCVGNAGIRSSTLMRIGWQLLGERFNPALLARRPVFQTLLFWDVFRKHYNPLAPPGYASFFTNHIAGVMHRYWKDVFPEDFPDSARATEPSREPLMRFALSILDDILKDVFRWQAINPQIAVVFASSMGQGPIHRDYHEGLELHITDIGALLHAAGLTPSDFKPLLAMVPQVAADVPSEAKRAKVIAWLESCTTKSGSALFKVCELGTSVSITVVLPNKSDIDAGYAQHQSASLQFPQIGLTRCEIEAGTGYHIPEGAIALLIADQSVPDDKSRRSFAASHYKDWVLELVATGRHDPLLLFR